MKDPRMGLLYRFARATIGRIAQPTLTGSENVPQDKEVVYVLQQRATTDLVMLDLACEANALVSPRQPLEIGDFAEQGRVFALYRAKRGRFTMQSLSQRLARLLAAPHQVTDQTVLIPVSVFWGRAMSAEYSWWRNLTVFRRLGSHRPLQAPAQPCHQPPQHFRAHREADLPGRTHRGCRAQ